MYVSSFDRFVTDVAVLAVTVRSRLCTPLEDVAGTLCQTDEDRDSVSEAEACDASRLLIRDSECLYYRRFGSTGQFTYVYFMRHAVHVANRDAQCV